MALRSRSTPGRLARAAVIASVLLFSVASEDESGAYDIKWEGIGSSWCPRTVAVTLDATGCIDRGVGDATLLDRAVREAVVLWNDSGAEFNFEYFGVSTNTTGGNPIPIVCRGSSEDDHFDPEMMSPLAYAQPRPGARSCLPFYGLDSCKVIVNSDVPWGFDVQTLLRDPDAFLDTTPSLAIVLAHELGHCMGFNHEDDEDPFQLMGTFYNDLSHLTFDDTLGAVNNYGPDHQRILTQGLEFDGGEFIALTTQETLSLRTMGPPSAAGNPDPAADFDYAVAYLTRVLPTSPPITEFRVRLALLRDRPDGTVEVLSDRETPFTSTMPPSVAVNEHSEVGIAWTSANAGRQVRFAMSPDGGATWVQPEMLTYRAVGAPGLAFSLTKNRWVLAWIAMAGQTGLGVTEPTKFKIATMVSSNATGDTWLNTGRVYDDEFTSHHGVPAIACSDVTGVCSVLYSQYGAGLHGVIGQRALAFTDDLGHLDSLTTFTAVGGRTYGNVSLVRFSGGYLNTHPGSTTRRDWTRYRFKLDEDYPADVIPETQPWTRDSTIEVSFQSRDGVRAAFNRNTGRMRFFWVPD